jgi:methylmalonyl-CoA/ethylmalonyl-CoA epimerase
MLSGTLSHIGIAVADITKALASYRELFGYKIYSGPFDDPLQKVSVCFLETGKPGAVTIELVTPTEADSPVNRILSKEIGAYHLCYEVDDLGAALQHCRSRGCIVISEPVPAVAFAGRPIAWVYTPTRQLTELVGRKATD